MYVCSEIKSLKILALVVTNLHLSKNRQHTPNQNGQTVDYSETSQTVDPITPGGKTRHLS